MVLTVKNENNQWNKPEHDSRLGDFPSPGIDEFWSLLPFCKKNIVMCLTKQRYVVFYLGILRYILFYTGMIVTLHL